jgi:hypothetical protein
MVSLTVFPIAKFFLQLQKQIKSIVKMMKPNNNPNICSTFVACVMSPVGVSVTFLIITFVTVFTVLTILPGERVNVVVNVFVIVNVGMVIVVMESDFY